MIAAGLYLLKVVACSALICWYYFLALRNKVFHQWNRFYLLLSVLLSLLLPLLQFTVFHTPEDGEKIAIQLLNAVNAPAEPLFILPEESVPVNTAWPLYVYGFICLLFLVGIATTLLKIYRLIQSHPVQPLQNVLFVPTTAPGTPFSFLYYIFWNTAIDVNTPAGNQIFKHELVHIKERHTIDKLFLQTVLSFFWCNPFFWIMRYELQMMHEFIADKKAVHQQDATLLAALILQTAYPQRYTNLINPFFQHSIKRRLAMLTQLQNPRINYISRLLLLPLLAFLVLAFTIKTQTLTPQAAAHLKNKLVVVIDAGHGGNDGGATVAGLTEKELTLEIAKQIGALNSNKNLELVFTRTGDETVSLQHRTAVAQKASAGLLVSIHINAASSTGNFSTTNQKASGFEVTVPADTALYGIESKRLGSAILQAINPVYKTATQLKSAKMRLFVLDQKICPAIILECGYLTNQQDLAFIKQPANQKLIAQKILAGIEMYAASLSANQKRETDTLPAGIRATDIAEINMQADKRIELKLKNGTTYNSSEAELRKAGIVNDAIGIIQTPKPAGNATQMSMSGTVQLSKLDTTKQPLLVINGEVYPYNALTAVNPNTIASIDVLKDGAAITKWGNKGQNGVISIKLKTGAIAPDKKGPFTKPANQTIEFSSDSVNVSTEGNMTLQAPTITTENHGVFTKVEVEPQFPGGVIAWRKFLEKNLSTETAVKNKAPRGSYNVRIQFIVEKDGSLSDLKAISNNGYGLEEEALSVIKRGPKWITAKQNGHVVKAYKTQIITFVVSN